MNDYSKLLTEKYPPRIIEACREMLGVDGDSDTSKDKEIFYMSPNEVFSHVTTYDGLFNYDYKIRSWVEAIYKIDLNN